MATASLHHGVTITGAILLVTGTLCFAWWSDGEMQVPSSSDPHTIPHGGEAEPVTSPSSSNAMLRSISFFCCGIGGLLLLFGLLWSANAGIVSQRYRYHFSRDLHYVTVEPLEKENCSTWEASSTIPTYEEALNCQSAENPLNYIQPYSVKQSRPPLYQAADENDLWQNNRRRTSSDSALFRNILPRLESGSWDDASIVCDTPPPSYESISSRDGCSRDLIHH